jgi:3-oxoacyl-[acyl-carrier protein] reductase
VQKVALITGGTRGIGRAIAAEFAKDHQVVTTWNTTAPQSDQVGSLDIRADLSKPAAPQSIIDQVITHYGRLDVIVNNAGVIAMSPLDAFDAAKAHEMMAVNVIAPQSLLCAALPHLNEGAAIVNISSVNADLPPRDAGLYGASKAALNLWTRAMAKELGPRGIRVNAVAPGATNIPEAPRSPELTALFAKETALGRVAAPQDIAPVVHFLASDAARFITGEVIAVSGGYRL